MMIILLAAVLGLVLSPRLVVRQSPKLLLRLIMSLILSLYRAALRVVATFSLMFPLPSASALLTLFWNL
jgi:hypothetical protein